MRRQSLIALASVSLVAVAGTAILSEVRAQEVLDRAPLPERPVTVTFGTDPGAAHPRYAEPVAYAEATAGPASLSYEEPAPVEVAARAPTRASTRVTVQAGDTVYGIARRFGVSPSELIATNRLAAPYTLSLGQNLLVPQEGLARPAAIPAAVARPTPAVAPATPAPSGLGPIERVEAREMTDGGYTVRPGDTLFGLARQFGVPVASLAEANNLQAPYTLSLGQRIAIPAAAPATPIEARPAVDPFAEAGPQLVSTGGRFAWPLRGVVIKGYGPDISGERNDGINIAAPMGTPIRAAADGEVVYKGDELEGYGNLVLVRHEDGWVSAYAHTDAIMVRKGEEVRQGQVIAKVGQSGSVGAPQLHFELRRDLKPQDPIAALGGDGATSTAARY
jgi:murein DD-endopeptidase MepM/ murein hydrolase activator NlpD